MNQAAAEGIDMEISFTEVDEFGQPIDTDAAGLMDKAEQALVDSEAELRKKELKEKYGVSVLGMTGSFGWVEPQRKTQTLNCCAD